MSGPVESAVGSVVRLQYVDVSVSQARSTEIMFEVPVVRAQTLLAAFSVQATDLLLFYYRQQQASNLS